VRFPDGNGTLRARILASAQQWSSYANIRFVRVNAEPSDIRVSSASGDNRFWSYYGNDADNYPGQQTVHLGFVDGAGTSEAYLNEYVWHEFGHALAAVHEHQSPSSPILWNKPVVYQYYADNYGWSRDLVDDNIFYMFSADDVSATPFDPLSIMLYAFPKEFTTNGYSTHDNAVLSDVDKSFMRTMSPGLLLDLKEIVVLVSAATLTRRAKKGHTMSDTTCPGGNLALSTFASFSPAM
jgi:serralysin